MRNVNVVSAAVVMATLMTLGGCASAPKQANEARAQSAPLSPGLSEQLISPTDKERPGWISVVPDTVNGIMSFVGLSGNPSTEADSRDQAEDDAAKRAVHYMGTLVKDKFEKASTSFGLASSVEDRTVGVNAYEKQLAVNMANKVKGKEYYTEKWQMATGIAYRTFVLAHVSEQALQEASKKTSDEMASKAEQQAKEAADDVARRQAKKAAEFWKQMRDQGVTE